MKKGFLIHQSLSEPAKLSDTSPVDSVATEATANSIDEVGKNEGVQDTKVACDEDGLDRMEYPRIYQYGPRMQKFVNAFPFQTLEVLQLLMRHEENASIYKSATMPDEMAYPHIQRVYYSAATNRKILREAGEEINRLGGFPLMQGCYYMLANASPLSITGHKANDAERANWFYSVVNLGWDGIGEWRC